MTYLGQGAFLYSTVIVNATKSPSTAPTYSPTTGKLLPSWADKTITNLLLSIYFFFFSSLQLFLLLWLCEFSHPHHHHFHRRQCLLSMWRRIPTDTCDRHHVRDNQFVLCHVFMQFSFLLSTSVNMIWYDIVLILINIIPCYMIWCCSLFVSLRTVTFIGQYAFYGEHPDLIVGE